MKLFEEDYDPLPKISKNNRQFKFLVANRLGRVFWQIKSKLNRYSGGYFSFSREGNYFNFNSKKIDISSFLPHFGIVVLFLSVLTGSIINQTQQFQSYQELQGSILKPSEIETICKSIDKYTYVIKENELPFFSLSNNRESSEQPTLVTSRGFLSHPEAVLTSFSSEVDSNEGLKTRDQLIFKYKVKKGDSLSAIANKYNISVSTLRWANQLDNLDYITTGEEIVVPKKDGVWHTASKGESLSSLVKKYSANLKETLSFNGLNKNDKIKVGQKILIVDGEKPFPRVASAAGSTNSSTSTQSSPSPASTYSSGGSSYNTFPYGWCTWYVASRKNIPWIGNARDWLSNSRAMGYQTGHTPAVGSIIVLNESWWGHVGIVEAVYGNQVKFSEMNGVAGWGKVNTRTIPSYHSGILGYIYK